MWRAEITKTDGKVEDITQRVGSVRWSDSTDQLGAEFSFSIPFSKWDENFKSLSIAPGSLFRLYNGSTLWFQGIITTTPVNDSEYSGYDLSWYLNQSTTTIQFKKIRADKAIKQLCSKFGVPVGTISTMKTTIKATYKDKTPADIIKSILKKAKAETGVSHRLEMKNGKLCITKLSRIEITPTYIDELGRRIPCVNTAEITGSRSIEEMKNSVTYTGKAKGKKKKTVKVTAKSSLSIKKYGLISTVVSADNLTTAKARQRAKNKLKSLNKVTVTLDCRMRGSILIRPGRWIQFPKSGIGASGWFKVKSCTHEIVGDDYFVEMEMTN